MISWLLAAFHARKWLVELVLFLAIAGGIYLFCQHLIGVGISQERAAWTAKLAEAQRKADIESARLSERARIAEAATRDELLHLASYRASHPLHGRLCPQGAAGVPSTSSTDANHAGASPAARDFLSLPEGNTSGLDQQHLLDVLAGRADAVSASLREWQGRQ